MTRQAYWHHFSTLRALESTPTGACWQLEGSFSLTYSQPEPLSIPAARHQPAVYAIILAADIAKQERKNHPLPNKQRILAAADPEVAICARIDRAWKGLPGARPPLPFSPHTAATVCCRKPQQTGLRPRSRNAAHELKPRTLTSVLTPPSLYV